MALSYASNIASLQAQTGLKRTNTALSETFTRLSSGLRINSASDDPAGLALATSLQSDARIFAAGIKNISDGISVTNIAGDALQQLSDIVTRQRELADQASSSSATATQREALDDEAQALAGEFLRIVASTEFNNSTLLNGSLTSLTLQAANSPISFQLPNVAALLGGAEMVNDGTFQALVNYTATLSTSTFGESATGDFNNDGNLDLVQADVANARFDVLLGNGDGTFLAARSYGFAGSSPDQLDIVYAIDFNNDGYTDVLQVDHVNSRNRVYLANSDGSFGASTSWTVGDARDIYAADVSGDGFADILAPLASGVITVRFGNGNGTFQAIATYTTGGFAGFIRAADFDGDDDVDLAVTNNTGNKVVILTANGDGTFLAARSYDTGSGEPTSLEVGDLNNDGYYDIVTANYTGNSVSVLLGNGDGSFRDRTTYTAGTQPYHISIGDLNGDGYADFVSADRVSDTISLFIGNGNGTFLARVSISTGADPNSAIIGDFNNDNVNDIYVAQNGTGRAGIVLGNGVASGLVTNINLRTQSNALESVTILESAKDSLVVAKGTIGGAESRLTFAVDYMQVQRENYAAAANKIVDIDAAHEVAKLVRLQVLQQAASAVLAQANLQPQRVLDLLDGLTTSFSETK